MMDREAEIVSAVIGVAVGMIFGGIAFFLTSHSPNEVCRSDCEVRGFEQGKFITFDPEHCTCWNEERVFEEVE